jgi:hypothetical protein
MAIFFTLVRYVTETAYAKELLNYNINTISSFSDLSIVFKFNEIENSATHLQLLSNTHNVHPSPDLYHQLPFSEFI